MPISISDFLGTDDAVSSARTPAPHPDAQRNELRVTREAMQTCGGGEEHFQRWEEVEFIPNASPFKKEFLDTNVLIFWDYLSDISDDWRKELLSQTDLVEKRQLSEPNCRVAYHDGKIGLCFVLGDSRFLRRKILKTTAN